MSYIFYFLFFFFHFKFDCLELKFREFTKKMYILCIKHLINYVPIPSKSEKEVRKKILN